MKYLLLLASLTSTIFLADLHAQSGPTPFPTTDADWPGKGPSKYFPYMDDNRKGFWDRRAQDQGAIVLAGDSLTAGPHWEDLQKAFPDQIIANRGIGGDTSRGLLFRFQEDVLDLHPKAIMILIGDNDLSAHGKPDDTIFNIGQMVDMAQKQDPSVPIILCTTPPRNNPKAPTLPGKQEELNDKIKGLASEKIKVIDLYPLYCISNGQQDPQYFQADLLHLAPAAYVKFQDALQKELQTLSLK
ncbi:hypothetical protein BH09VER1_BH09VER1_28020 [soil metagenome]